MQVKKKGLKVPLSKQLATIGKAKVSAGFYSSGVYPSGISVAAVAYIQEFGAPKAGIPPRPFFRPAMLNNETTWRTTFEKNINKCLATGADPIKAFKVAGLQMQTDIQKAIKDVTKPPLKKETVEARLRGKANSKKKKSVSLTIAKPLIDSGYMLSQVTHEVTR